jgi:thioredoxin-dependent peroxiredoxin
VSFFTWLGLAADGSPLEIGADAPDALVFTVDGDQVHLSEYYGPGFTLVYFYPRAETSGCTKQACSLRDAFAVLKQEGVGVVGISVDGPQAQKRFALKHHLPFTLLADPNRNSALAFGVPLIAGMFRRQSFLVRECKIVWRDLHAATAEQAADVLKALESL